MAFLVEDGSGIALSNAYIAVQEFRDHHIDRGNTAHIDFTDDAVKAGIIRASDYVDKRFGRMFVGSREKKSQGMEWPRISGFDQDGFLLSDIDDIPRQLKKAVAEYTLRTLICGVLSPDPLPPVPKQDLTDSSGTRNQDVVTGEIQRKRERVGPLEEETWYQTQSQVIAKNLGAGATGVKSALVNDFVIPEYPEADLWLEELLRGSMSIRLARGD